MKCSVHRFRRNPDVIDRQAYLQAVEKFDRLWSCGKAPQDQDEMLRLLHVIESYENTPVCVRG